MLGNGMHPTKGDIIRVMKKRLDYIEGVIDDHDMSKTYRLEEIKRLLSCKFCDINKEIQNDS